MVLLFDGMSTWLWILNGQSIHRHCVKPVFSDVPRADASTHVNIWDTLCPLTFGLKAILNHSALNGQLTTCYLTEPLLHKCQVPDTPCDLPAHEQFPSLYCCSLHSHCHCSAALPNFAAVVLSSCCTSFQNEQALNLYCAFARLLSQVLL